jgi:hypothetical protein
MRKLVLLAPRSDLEGLEGLPSLAAIEMFRVVHQFRFDPTAISGVCEVKFANPGITPERMAGQAGLTKVETLAQRKDGSYLAYFEGRPTAGWARFAASSGARLLPPFELTPKSWRISALGTAPQLRRFLGELRRRKVHYRVQSFGDPDVSAKLHLGLLTARQREVLKVAHQAGYYDVPRRGDSTRVATALRLGKSTTVEHLRKAEKRLIDAVMSE